MAAASAQGRCAIDGPAAAVVPAPRARALQKATKTGLLHRARGEGAHRVPAYMDYERKVAGLGPLFTPTGDVERDMEEVKRFYAGVKGRNADQFDVQ